MPTLHAHGLRALAQLTVGLSLCGFASVAVPSQDATPAPGQAAPTIAPSAAPATSAPSTTQTPSRTPAPATTSSPTPTPAPSAATPQAPAPAAAKKVVYIAIPHPDDEFEAAAQYSDTPDEFKVFVLMTRGESTYHCEPAGYRLSLLAGVAPAAVAPLGIRTASCEKARLASWTGYFAAMSAADRTLPGDFSAPVTTRPFPTRGVQLTREARALEQGAPGATSQPFTDTTAQVWIDKQGRGVLIDFDLGDGNLTAARVSWAMRTVLDNRPEFGIDPTLADIGVVGAYSNMAARGCFIYRHRDHAALANALRNVDFGLRRQQVATCRTDPDATATRTVAADELKAAYPPDGSSGAFAANYGWLETPVISRTDQSSLFMGVQTFDVRHQHVQVKRVAGSDRFSTAAAISRASYPGSAPVVYVASARNFPDALSAGAAAARQGGPLLLTSPDGLPAVIAEEVARLHPTTAVIVGGEKAVTPTVAAQLAALAPSVVRIAGSDRYDTSRRVVAYAFPAGSAPTAYVVSGSSFPDALSATGVAGAQGAPVLLVAPGDTVTVAGTLAMLQPKSITVVGGNTVIPSSVDTVLGQIAPVHRVAGSDRFGTNAAVVRSVFSSSDGAFVASGLNFPDALSGAAWAGHAGTPLLLARGGCFTKAGSDALAVLGTTGVTLLGGRDVVGDGISDVPVC